VLNMRTKLALLLLVSAAVHAANLPHGSVELLSKYNRAARMGPLKLGLHFQLEPGWHIYWKNPGDAGQAPRIHWTSPSGVDGGEIDWPAPDRLTAGPLVDFGYERDVLLPMSLDFPAGAMNEKWLELRGEVRALICREVCIPGRAEVSLSVPVQDDALAANPKVAALFIGTDDLSCPNKRHEPRVFCSVAATALCLASSPPSSFCHGKKSSQIRINQGA
jgi:DsbC/DsbD-like thiol-disulfide interchange protein